MQVAFYLALIIAIFYLSLYLNNDWWRHLTAHLRRLFRLHVIQKYGQLEAHRFWAEFRHKANHHALPKWAVERFISEQHKAIANELGHDYADKKLGPPSPLERYW
jgi:hypothetical protein